MKFIKNRSYKDYTIFYWIFLIALLGILVSIINKNNEEQKLKLIKESLNNIYLKKTIEEISINLKPRYNIVTYISKSGDTYESVLNKLDINQKERKLLLNTILNHKSLKILKINQKFKFKFDNLSKEKIVEFKIETDNKNEIAFYKSTENNNFTSKKIQKNFTKKLVYKEAVITNSLYSSAISLGIKPNVIVEFARLYGFQVDFQRDVWKDDSFQIIYEEFINSQNKVIDTGEIIFASLNLQNTDFSFINMNTKK